STLADACQYIPLTLFTNINTKHLHREGLTLKKVKSYINDVIHHLLDLPQFESEDGMDSFTWQEAWLHYLVWLADAAQLVIYDHWKWHYTMLLKDKVICDNFKAILTFDINIMTLSKMSFVSSPHETSVTLLHPTMSCTILLAKMSSVPARAKILPFGNILSPLTHIPSPSPSTSSASTLSTVSQTARKRLQQKANNCLLSTLEVILPITPTIPPSASPFTSPIQGKPPRVLPLLPNTSVLSLVSLPMAPSC
ncbi:hypothetical protein PAXRUDRAFT_764041, partial [Paxillus rubicundulus Ve08.2h10]